jgi:hypothetical protein
MGLLSLSVLLESQHGTRSILIADRSSLKVYAVKQNIRERKTKHFFHTTMFIIPVTSNDIFGLKSNVVAEKFTRSSAVPFTSIDDRSEVQVMAQFRQPGEEVGCPRDHTPRQNDRTPWQLLVGRARVLHQSPHNRLW